MKTMDTFEDVIVKHPFLSGLDPHFYHFFSERASFRRYEPGQEIFREHGNAEHFYLIQSGKVALEAFVPGRGMVTIQTLGPGEALGWSWLTPPNRWQFSASAIDRVTLSVFRVTDLRQLFKREPELGYWFMERAAQALLERLQATRHKLRVYVERASGDENTQQIC